MSYAIKIGTTGGRFVSGPDECAAGEVYYGGPWFTEANGFTPAMVWDAGLNNIRPRTPAEILSATKAARIAAINAEAQRRIYAVWPQWRQSTALAGSYGAAKLAEMITWVEGHTDPSNVANLAVVAATTIEQVEAVTVAWPAQP